MRHKTRIVAIPIVNGKKGSNLVFNSVNECADYFQALGHTLYAQMILRRIEDGCTWSYAERVTVNGQRKTVIHEFCFDESTDNEISERINGK